MLCTFKFTGVVSNFQKTLDKRAYLSIWVITRVLNCWRAYITRGNTHVTETSILSRVSTSNMECWISISWEYFSVQHENRFSLFLSNNSTRGHLHRLIDWISNDSVVEKIRNIFKTRLSYFQYLYGSRTNVENSIDH